MIDAHLKKLRKRDDISIEEERAIRGAVSETRSHPADRILIRQGEDLTTSTLLLDGIVCRYKDLRGGQRQIMELHVPGDFVDLHSFTLKLLDHDIMPLTPCRVAIVPHERLKTITERYPHLSRVYWFSTNLDAAIQREWTLSLGRRSAIARISHLFCEMHIRLEIVGLSTDFAFEFPLTQTDIADCVGMTTVHVNRTIQTLRRQGLIRFEKGLLTILDWAGLVRTAEFTPDYLYLERKVR